MIWRSVFVVFGFPSPLDFSTPGPLAFSDGPLPMSDPSLPSELSGAIVKPTLLQRPGYQFGADPRSPAGSGGTGTVIVHDADDDLHNLFLYDRRLPSWDVEALRVSASETSLRVTGDTAPEVDRVYWLDGEAVYTVSVTAETYRTYSVEVARGSGGAPARVHRLDPPRWTVGEDGSGDRLPLLSRPDIARSPRIYCAVYAFGLEEDGSISLSWVRRGVLSGEPTPGDGRTWSIPFRYLEDAAGDHVVGGGSVETAASWATFIGGEETNPVQGEDRSIVVPTRMAQRFTTREAELVFGESLRRTDATEADPALVDDLSDRLTSDQGIVYYLARNGGEFVFSIEGLYVRQYLDSSLRTVVDVVAFGSVRASKDKSKGVTDDTGEPLPGWTRRFVGERVSDPGSAPKYGLRVQITASRPALVATLLASQDGTSADPDDKFIAGIGAGIPTAYIDRAAALPSPRDVALDATSLVQLAQVYGERTSLVLDLTKRIPLRDILTNEAHASVMLFGQTQEGELGLRPWLTYTTPTTRVVTVNGSRVNKSRLAPVSSLDLSGGVNLATMESERTRTVRLGVLGSSGAALSIRIGKSALLGATDDDGALAEIVRAYLDLLGGAPMVYSVEASFEDVIRSEIGFGSSVLWSDDSEVTPRGRGFTDAEFIVIGISGLLDGGRCALRLMYNGLANTQTNTQTTPGAVPPSFVVVALRGADPASFEVELRTPQDATFRESSYSALWGKLVTASATVRIVTPTKQATAAANERGGSIDLYATVQSVRMDGARVVARLSAPSTWLRGLRLADLVIPFVSSLVLSDRRAADSNKGTTLLEPPSLVRGSERGYLSAQPLRTKQARIYTFGG